MAQPPDVTASTVLRFAECRPAGARRPRPLTTNAAAPPRRRLPVLARPIVILQNYLPSVDLELRLSFSTHFLKNAC
jgi:hypothetical protein